MEHETFIIFRTGTIPGGGRISEAFMGEFITENTKEGFLNVIARNPATAKTYSALVDVHNRIEEADVIVWHREKYRFFIFK